MRSAVLIVDPRTERRRALSRGLAADGYEVVPAANAEEGQRFALALEPAVIVAAAELGDGLARLLEATADAGAGAVLVLLGRITEGELPAGTHALADADADDLLRRVRLLLIGLEVGLEPDLELGELAGELARLPLLEVVRDLGRRGVSARVELDAGTVEVDDGRVVRARAGDTRGAKAFGRLSRVPAGPYRVALEPIGGEPEIEMPLDEMVIEALEEAHLDWPDPRSRVRVAKPRRAAAAAAGAASTHERRLVELIGRSSTVGELLDALPAADGHILRALDKLVASGAIEVEKPHTPVVVVCDSTADLPEELASSHGIGVVPLGVRFGDLALRDGIDLKARDFYDLLATGDEHPLTEPPTEAEFLEHFRHRVEGGDVLSVLISGELSKTVEHARRAAARGVREFDHLPEERRDFALEVIDTRSVSLGAGLLALAAARMARRGLGIYEILPRLKALAPCLHLLFVVDTLDYLVEGGRIGRARALVGRLFGIKPILGIDEGVVVAVGRARGLRQARQRIVSLLQRRLDPARPLLAGVAHAQAPQLAAELRRSLAESFDAREIVESEVGPVVGTHTGPGCFGCAVLQPDPENWPLVAPLEDG